MEYSINKTKQIGKYFSSEVFSSFKKYARIKRKEVTYAL